MQKLSLLLCILMLLCSCKKENTIIVNQEEAKDLGNITDTVPDKNYALSSDNSFIQEILSVYSDMLLKYESIDKTDKTTDGYLEILMDQRNELQLIIDDLIGKNYSPEMIVTLVNACNNEKIDKQAEEMILYLIKESVIEAVFKHDDVSTFSQILPELQNEFSGSTNFLNLLINSSFDNNSVATDSLHVSFKKDGYECISYLISINTDNLDSIPYKYDANIFVAAKNKDWQLLDILVSNGASLKITPGVGMYTNESVLSYIFDEDMYMKYKSEGAPDYILFSETGVEGITKTDTILVYDSDKQGNHYGIAKDTKIKIYGKKCIPNFNGDNSHKYLLKATVDNIEGWIPTEDVAITGYGDL